GRIFVAVRSALLGAADIRGSAIGSLRLGSFGGRSTKGPARVPLPAVTCEFEAARRRLLWRAAAPPGGQRRGVEQAEPMRAGTGGRRRRRDQLAEDVPEWRRATPSFVHRSIGQRTKRATSPLARLPQPLAPRGPLSPRPESVRSAERCARCRDPRVQAPR